TRSGVSGPSDVSAGGSTSNHGATPGGGRTPRRGGYTPSAGGGGASPSAGPPAIQSVSVDSNGNLVVNGKPFLLIAGEKLEYAWFGAAGYTPAQADAYMTQMQSWGFNTLGEGNWIQISPGVYQDQAAWQRHGFYWIGSATIDDQGHNAQGTFGLPVGDALITTIVNEFRTRPNLLRWWVTGEYSSPPPDLTRYATAVATVKAADPSRIVGEVMVDSAGWTNGLGATRIQQAFTEQVIGGQSSPSAAIQIQALYRAMSAMQNAKAGGAQFVIGASTTPLPELDSARPWGVLPSRIQIQRFFLLQVAMDSRAFEVLWGPNQRAGFPNNGDAGLPPGSLDVWNWTGQAIAQVKSLEPVILAPGLWQRVTTTPAFTILPPQNNIIDYRGIYGVKKIAGGITYVIAVNLNQVSNVETGLGGATIDVGFPINSATKMFESGPV